MDKDTSDKNGQCASEVVFYTVAYGMVLIQVWSILLRTEYDFIQRHCMNFSTELLIWGLLVAQISVPSRTSVQGAHNQRWRGTLMGGAQCAPPLRQSLHGWEGPCYMPTTKTEATFATVFPSKGMALLGNITIILPGLDAGNTWMS